MNKIWGWFKVQVGWQNAFYGETGSWKGLEKVSAWPWPLKKHFLTFTLCVNKIIIYQFSMFKSLDSIASVVGIFMYLTISKFKQVLRSWKGLNYNTEWHVIPWLFIHLETTKSCIKNNNCVVFCKKLRNNHRIFLVALNWRILFLQQEIFWPHTNLFFFSEKGTGKNSVLLLVFHWSQTFCLK